MPRRTLAELFRYNLDRAVIPIDEEGGQIFSADNPGYISDETTQAALAAMAETLDEIHDHNHTTELWWGALAAPTQDNAIEENVNRPFTLVSGNNTWGVAVPVVGRLDIPVHSWETNYAINRIVIAAVSNATPWRVRFLYGDQSFLEALNAERYTETMTVATGIGSNIDGSPADIRMCKLPVGWIIWAQAWNATTDATIEIFHGCHGYPPRCPA